MNQKQDYSNRRTLGRLTRAFLCVTALCVFSLGYAESAIAQDKSSEQTSKPKVVRKKPKGEAQLLPVLTKNVTDQAFRGYTIYPLEHDANVFLLSPSGELVNRWNVDADRALLLPNCNLLVVHGSAWGAHRPPWAELRYVARELRWDGSTAWEYRAPDVVHHDIHRLANGNTLLLIREIFAPFAPKAGTQSPDSDMLYNGDRVIEIDPKGTTVFDWKSSEAFAPDYCGRRPCEEIAGYRAKKKVFDWTHANTSTVIPDNRWYRAGDKRFKPGNILLMARNFWTVYLIDRDSREIVWKYQGTYRGGLGPAHEPHMIPEGFPGAGNILIFNNFSPDARGESQILEINPTTQEIVWKYDPGAEFNCERSGSVQRLENGNTLISDDKQGRVFEVTPVGEVVWEMRSKFEVNRARKYPVGYCEKLL